MKKIRKIIEKIKSGWLKEFFSELMWIYRYGMRYKLQILWYILLGIVGTGMGLTGTVASKYIVDALTELNLKALVPAAVFYVAMQLLQIGSNALTGRINAHIRIRVDQEIRADVYEKIMDSDWESVKQFHSGDILSRVNGDASTVAGSVLNWIPNLFTRLVQFVGSLVIILYYDPTLALLALLSAPLLLIVSKHLTSKMRDYSKKTREISSDVLVFNEESFQNIQIIKSFGITRLYTKKLHELQQKDKDTQLSYNLFSVRTSFLLSLVSLVVTAICFGWCLHRVLAGYITVGTLVLFLQMSDELSGAFSSLMHMVPQAISATTAAGRIMAVTELPREDHTGDEAAAAFLKANRSCGVSIAADNLCFGYMGSDPVLEDISFTARPGEIIALVGSSGEGKTTLLRLILGIVSPKSGSIRAEGSNDDSSVALSPSTRKLFSYVPQGNTMFSGTVAENLRLMNQNATEEMILDALRTACADDFILRLPDGINTPIQEMGGGFSHGQIQRLSIARALLADSPVLLLDEATSALDVETEQKLLQNIMGLQNNRRTCIVTTHRPSVLSICSRVYVISDGRMKQADSTDIANLIREF